MISRLPSIYPISHLDTTMLSRTHTKSTKKSTKGSSMSSKGWACCRCSNFNPSRHHVCHGPVSLQDDYDKACNHWHCPTCHPLDSGKPIHSPQAIKRH
jgi:hypothetical protein